MTKTEIYAGRCSCNNELDFYRISLIEDEGVNEGNVICYVMYSNCKKCKATHIQGLIKGSKEPKPFIDYAIDCDKKVKEGDKLCK